jgi:5-formyltetrahydrofolate cyclo-ligase
LSSEDPSSLLQRKRQLRRLMRQTRRKLSRREQQQAANILSRKLSQNSSFKFATHIALYLANDGEINTQLAIQQAWQRGQTIYLPTLNPIRKGFLWFVEYRPNSPMRTNRFGITEPDPKHNKRIAPRFLQVVGLPLVAFDSQGNRLGMGGGFYDRSFEFCRQAGTKPKLFGLAHQCQQVEALPLESWDMQLEDIISA